MKKTEKSWLESFKALRHLGHSPRKAREALHKLGPSQQEVAKILEIGRKCYNNYISGIRKDREQQKRIAEFWEIPSREFFADTYEAR